MSMDEKKALELIDAHLDQQTLTDAESDALTQWVHSDPQHADAAFFRVFLHSYLRFRVQTGLPTASAGKMESAQPIDVDFTPVQGSLASNRRPGIGRAWGQKLGWGCGLLLAGCLGFYFWANTDSRQQVLPEGLWAYEGFDYPATKLPLDEAGEVIWPTYGGLHGLNGGKGWAEGWSETNSKVATIVDYEQPDLQWKNNDMRKFGPLEFRDENGHRLQTSGHQMRTATSPRSITVRRFNFTAFPSAFKDETGLGRNGAIVWFSLLAQSSSSSAQGNHYSYLALGSKDVSGFRLGKLGASPAGNWTAVGLLTGAEVNLQASSIPSGQKVFLVTKLTFRPGAEEALVWINPSLDREPKAAEAAMQLEVPDFRFDGVAIHANHSTDFDEIRFGSSFQAVSPRQL